MRNDQDAMEFLKEIETRRGGSIGWKTYSTWFSDCTNIREYGVFFYEVNGVLYYEDFERRPTILGFQLPKKKNAPEYVKLEGSFDGRDVTDIVRLTKSRATSFIYHQDRIDLLKPANFFEKFFRQVVTMVELSDGRRLFFEFLDEKEFRKLIDGTQV